MAPSDCEIVPTRDSRTFHFRVRFTPPEDPAAGRLVHATTIVGGRKFLVLYFPPALRPEVMVAMKMQNHPVPEGNAKVSARMVLLDKTGSPAPSVGTCTTTHVSTSRFMDGAYKLTAAWDDVKANCVVDNYFVVACSVDINWTPPTPSLEQELPSLGHDLTTMWDKQDLQMFPSMLAGRASVHIASCSLLDLRSSEQSSMARWLKARCLLSSSKTWRPLHSVPCSITCTMVRYPLPAR